MLIGLVSVLPQIMFVFKAGDSYRGINIAATDAEDFYASRIRDVYDGHYLIGNSFLQSGKNLPFIAPFLPELIIGSVGRFSHLTVSSIINVFRFLCPAALFLLLYFFLLKLFGRKSLALSAPALIFFLSSLLNSSRSIFYFFAGGLADNNFLYYSRPVHPEISSLFLFGFLSVFYSFFLNGKKIFGWLSLIFFGISVYIYPYLWLFLAALLGVFLIWAAVKKNWPRFKQLLMILLGGLALSFFYFINYFAAIKHFSYPGVVLSYNLISTHQQVISGLILVSLGLLAIMYFYGREEKIKKAVVFLGLAVISLLVVLNQQLITGYWLQPGHFHWYITKPLFFITAVLFLVFALERLKASGVFKNIFFGSLIVLAFGCGILI